MTNTETRHTRYRAGLCVECGEKPYSAGRTRCDACHEAWMAGGQISPEFVAAAAIKSNYTSAVQGRIGGIKDGPEGAPTPAGPDPHLSDHAERQG